MDKKVTWGILGPGIIAHEFVQDFQHVESAIVGAVASRSKERAKDFANQHAIPSYYEGYEALYSDPSIDCIYIATPHNFHFAQTLEAMNAGKAVFCEKPITVNVEECQALINASAEKDIYLAEAMWTYFLPTIIKAKEWIAEGRKGKLLHVKANFGYPVPFDPKSRYYDPELAGGSLYDMGIYPIAIAHLFIGKAPATKTIKSIPSSTGVDVDTIMQFDYEEETALLHSAFRCKLHNHAYLIGEEGYIDIPDFWRARECHLYVHENVVDSYYDQRKGHGFEFEIESITRDLMDSKKESTIVSHQTSLELQKLLEDVRNNFAF